MKTIYKILVISFLAGYIFNHAYAGPSNSLVDADFNYQNTFSGYNVIFSVASTVSPNDIYNYTWTIEDSTFTTFNDTIEYTFPQEGYYNVCFTTLDIDTIKDTRCKTIHVTYDPQAIQNDYIDFTYYVDTINNKIELSISDNMESFSNDMAFFWNFNNTSTAKGAYPSFYYDDPGIYTISMTVKDSVFDHRNYTVTKKVVAGTPPCNAHFNLWVSEDTAQFINHSSPNTTKFFWSFGDGTFSDLEHPEHIYTNNGIYEVKLVAFDPNKQCLDAYTEKIRIGKNIDCHADFEYFVDSALMDVHLENTSLGSPQNHVWIFGDGTISHDFSPLKGFSKPGYYSARLIVSNPFPDFCIDQVKKNILISRTGEDVEAEFFYHVSGKKVSLLNKSVGQDMSYTWNFGDFDPENYRKDSVSKSHDMNPQFTYSKSGYYNVCLTAHSRLTGTSDFKCKKIRIGIPAKDCKANLIYTLKEDAGDYSIRFLDRSFSHGIINKRTWAIHDTTFDNTIGNMYHLPDTGLYTLKLQIEDNLGCISRDYALINAGIAGKLYGAYDFNIIDTINFKSTGYPVDFVGISHGDAAKLKWDFDGDGTWDDSTSSNPTHVYTAPGEYYCKLQVSDPNTGDVDTYIDTVKVGGGLEIDQPVTDKPALNIYPNPFATSAQIEYTLQEQSDVNITLFDTKGNSLINLVNTDKPKGNHQVILNKGNLETGIYYLQIKTNKGVAGKKIIMIK